mgnify:FL=1
MIAVPVNVSDKNKGPETKEMAEKRARPPHNTAMELLNESESEVSECHVESQEKIIEEYNLKIALSKKETECRTLTELKELQELKAK